jgi:predicted double-glycine peptidase
MFCIAAMAFFAGRRITRRTQQHHHILILLACIALAMAYVSLARDSAWQIMFMPFTNTIVYGKWLFIIVAFAAGLLSSSGIIRPFSKLFLIPALLFVGSMDFGEYVLYPKPPIGNIVIDSIVGQSSDATCSPAACATFLRLYHVKVLEKQMVEACLTTRNGTPNQGIWRALKMYVPDGYKVSVARFKDYHSLPFPVLVNLKLKEGDINSGRYSGQWGWRPGIPHTVVLLGHADNGKLLVADPATGMDVWDYQILDVLWDKVGFFFKGDN